MIVSVSRRTDIPQHYAAWFFQRLAAGEALVRNPMNPRQVSRLRLGPDTVDGWVFWSKYPAPMLPHLDALAGYPYYFQFTLTGYGQDLEPGVPDKDGQVVPLFLELSQRLGPERVLWRYDPVLLSPTYTVDFHRRRFEQLARRLADATCHCTLSFVDAYPSILKTLRRLDLRAPDAQEQQTLAGHFASVAQAYGLTLSTCAEAVDLAHLGIGHGACVDAARLARIAGWPLAAPKDLNQRGACGCTQSVDLGAYNTCANGCAYCYASYRPASITAQIARHDPASPLLVGHLEPGDTVRDRPMPRLREGQIRML